MKKSFTVWFTGLPCSGKTSLAHALSRAFKRRRLPCEHLDGDALRLTLSKDLGYSKSDRKKHMLRVARLARDLNDSGSIVLVALISPYRKTRLEARHLIGHFVEAYVACPLSVREKRDVKGLYRLARQGRLKHFTGVSDPYEAPKKADITLRTDRDDVEHCVARIMGYLLKRCWLPAPKRKQKQATRPQNQILSPTV